MTDSMSKAQGRARARRQRAAAARRARLRSRWIRIGGIAAAVLALAALSFAVIRANTGPSPATSAPSVAVTAEDPVLGKADAPVTIVEYGDFKCPFCTRFFEQTQPQLRRDYIDTGKVRLVWRDFPNIDQESPTAAAAAWCAGRQHHFWQYHDALYRYVWHTFYSRGASAEGVTAYTGHYQQIAAQAGVTDQPAFTTCLDSQQAQRAVGQDRDQGARQGVSGTPTFFVNGHKVVGAQPYSLFAQLIEQELR